MVLLGFAFIDSQLLCGVAEGAEEPRANREQREIGRGVSEIISLDDDKGKFY